MEQSLSRKIILASITLSPLIYFAFITVVMLMEDILWIDHLFYLFLFIIAGIISMILSILYLKKHWFEIDEVDQSQFGKLMIHLSVFQILVLIVIYVISKQLL